MKPGYMALPNGVALLFFPRGTFPTAERLSFIRFKYGICITFIFPPPIPLHSNPTHRCVITFIMQSDKVLRWAPAGTIFTVYEKFEFQKGNFGFEKKARLLGLELNLQIESDRISIAAWTLQRSPTRWSAHFTCSAQLEIRSGPREISKKPFFETSLFFFLITKKLRSCIWAKSTRGDFKVTAAGRRSVNFKRRKKGRVKFTARA